MKRISDAELGKLLVDVRAWNTSKASQLVGYELDGEMLQAILIELVESRGKKP